MLDLQDHFAPFRHQIIGVDQTFATPHGRQPLVYADWTASGRLYAPIEERMREVFAPLVGNTHSEATLTGTAMTQSYHYAQQLIKRHVNAGPADVLLLAGSGMTAVINKLQRLLGLKLPEQLAQFCTLPTAHRPVVFITHMEHHSNQTSWLETVADVVIVPPGPQGSVDPEQLADAVACYADRSLKIGSFTACSNVSGVKTPIHALARVMHEAGGWCFVDFAASAPYVSIDMHPADPLEKLDAVLFSPHKFLGGPGTPGVLVMDSALYHNRVPDQPGGGTVLWTNPWSEHEYIGDIESREDGGTPAFLQTIRAALAVQLKEQMDPARMLERERQLTERTLTRLRTVPGLRVLADGLDERLAIFSFIIDALHYNLVVKLLNDRFGVQVRGGCSCAGTYGHYLLHIEQPQSRSIVSQIHDGDLSLKPGWVRMSLHPTTPDSEVTYILDAIEAVARNGAEWAADYHYDRTRNEFFDLRTPALPVREWFDLTAQRSVLI